MIQRSAAANARAALRSAIVSSSSLPFCNLFSNLSLSSSFHFHQLSSSSSSSFHNTNNNPNLRNALGLGFTSLDDALTSFNHMVQMRPLPSLVKFTQLLTTIAKNKHYSTTLYLIRQLDLRYQIRYLYLHDLH